MALYSPRSMLLAISPSKVFNLSSESKSLVSKMQLRRESVSSSPVDARGRLDAASKSEVHMLDGEVAIDSYAIVVAIDIDCHNYRFCKRGWVSLAAIAFASIST